MSEAPERLAGDRKHPVELTVNGRSQVGYAAPRMLLADFLRHELGHYGTHVGCEHGVCGACTVLVDGVPSRSCTIYAVQMEGAAIETVEGLADGGALTALQEAFRKHHALQCGFCTAGILISATAFLKEQSNPTETEVREMLSGHLCRCTGYEGMVRAVLEIAGADGAAA